MWASSVMRTSCESEFRSDEDACSSYDDVDEYRLLEGPQVCGRSSTGGNGSPPWEGVLSQRTLESQELVETGVERFEDGCREDETEDVDRAVVDL